MNCGANTYHDQITVVRYTWRTKFDCCLYITEPPRGWIQVGVDNLDILNTSHHSSFYREPMFCCILSTMGYFVVHIMHFFTPFLHFHELFYISRFVTNTVLLWCVSVSCTWGFCVINITHDLFVLCPNQTTLTIFILHFALPQWFPV